MSYVADPAHGLTQIAALLVFVLLLAAAFAIILGRIDARARRAVTLGLLALGRNDMADAYDLAVENKMLDEVKQQDWMTSNVGKPFELTYGAWMVPLNSTSAAYGNTRDEALEAAAKYLPAEKLAAGA
ncbi:hypothetical protein C5E10_06215 [Pseudoclavibacter sp. RFBG4]|uniref:hypothetical protein n=1 Tax=Pseudoclavibacter sp. RFBG4 TaxID=2080575 RepID=UPI000CE74F29|nr:hypothetical protein [Pseudoclavibacter sp. RFBG4]PPG35182.1 hypothetical protein C5E10_06215 [Pseudoclavibacter sp. RFBG4]